MSLQTFRSNAEAKPKNKQITVKKEHDYFVKHEHDDGQMFISESVDVHISECAGRSSAKAKRKNQQIITEKRIDYPVKQEPADGQIGVCGNSNVREPDVSPNQILQQKFEEMVTEVEKLKFQLESAKTKHQHEKSELMNQNKALSRENKSMAARIKQLQTGVDSATQSNGAKHKNKKGVLIEQNRVASSDSSDENVYEVEKILSHKTVRRDQLFLIRWKGFDSSHDSWEKKENLNCSQKLQKYFSRI